MYTDEQFDQLEQEQFSLTEEALAILLLALGINHDSLEREVTTFYHKYGDNGVVTYSDARKWVSNKDHRRRLVVLYSFIWDMFDVSFVDFESKFRNHLIDIVESEIKFFGLEPSLFDIDKILDTSWGVDDLTWSQRLLAYQDKWSPLLSNDLKVSFIRRDNLIDALESLDGRFTSMEKILKRLYVTESTAVSSITRREIFKHLGISHFRFYTREDEKTCEHCGSLHGLVFPISAYEVGVTAPPVHSNCRCQTIPILD